MSNVQVRDSPGPSVRSTASMDGWTSSVGSGAAGSTSSSSGSGVLKPNPTPPERLGACACPFEKSENTEGVRARCPGTNGCWLGEATSEDGESIENSPADSDEDRPCEPRRPGGPPPATKDCALRDDEMSMLPPPTAFRLSSCERRCPSTRVCSGDAFASGSGVSVRVPSSWAYAYRMSSVLDGGKADENALRGGFRYAVEEEGGGPCPIPRWEGRRAASREAAVGCAWVPFGFGARFVGPMEGIWVRMLGISVPGIGEGKEGVAGGPGDIDPASAIGPSEREKVEVEGFGVSVEDGEGGGLKSCNCSCPSKTEFFRA